MDAQPYLETILEAARFYAAHLESLDGYVSDHMREAAKIREACDLLDQATVFIP